MVIPGPRVVVSKDAMTLTFGHSAPLKDTVQAKLAGKVWDVEVQSMGARHVRLNDRTHGSGLDVYFQLTQYNGHPAYLISVPDICRCGIVPAVDTDSVAYDIRHALRLDNIIDAASIAAAVKWGESQ